MASVQIDVTAARAQLTKLTDRVAAGESFELTKRGKVVALLIPAVEIEGMGRPEIPKPVALTTEDPDIKASNSGHEHIVSKPKPEDWKDPNDMEVDDWGLPIDKSNDDTTLADVVRAVAPGGPIPKPANPAPLKPWKPIGGLSKSQQAGGKYDR